jgi:hypothetical protein
MRCWLSFVLLFGFAHSVDGHSSLARPWAVEDLPVVRRLQAPTVVPPMPAGTSVLRFEQFFRLPVGPRGLEPTPALRALDGKRIRLFGYMVLHDAPQPGVFLLSPMPVILAEQADGAVDDLPPAVVTVRLPATLGGRRPPFVPGILMVEGVLGVGASDEPDGRRSFVRLQLDWSPAASASGVLQ